MGGGWRGAALSPETPQPLHAAAPLADAHAMSLISDTVKLQRFAGVEPDGQFGSETAAALVKKLGLEDQSPSPPSGMRVAIDAGHGLSNRKPGVFDPGAVSGSLRESDVTLLWAKELVMAFRRISIPVFETRPTEHTAAPVGSRDELAEDARCTHFISIHVNDADSASATGVETLYRDDERFASKIQNALLAGLQLRDRGVKQRTDLAVLNFTGQAALIELGFIKNAGDVERFTDPDVIKQTCRLIAEAVS